MIRQWVNIQQLEDASVFEELQQSMNISICGAFRNFIQVHNAGRVQPCPYVWVDKLSKGVLLCKILSFNQEDDDNVFSTMKSLKEIIGGPLPYIPFGRDLTSSGIFGVNGTSVCVHDLISGKIIKVSDSFDRFMSHIFGNSFR